MVIGIKYIGQQYAENISILESSQKVYTQAEIQQLKQMQAAKKVVESALQYRYDINEVVTHLQKLSDKSGRKLQFHVNKDINRVIIKVIDITTDKVIREIPSEVVQKLRQDFEQLSGIFFDQTI